MAVTRTAVEDAAVAIAAEHRGITAEEYLQLESDQRMTSLRSDQLNDWWRSLPLDAADEAVITKKSVYADNQPDE